MQGSPSSLRALILEDEPRYRAFLAGVVRDMHCEPEPVASAAEAMQAAQAAPPDLLLLDLNLPVTDGIAFLHEFRRICPETPVVIITGFGSLEAARSAIRLGVSDFLSKPCDLGQLEQAIDRARRKCAGRGQLIDAPGASTIVESAPMPAHDQAIRSLAALERDAIIEALKLFAGNRSEASRRLGISRRALYNKIEEYRRQGLDIP
jgi:DNA-binding NtrC family response regulator